MRRVSLFLGEDLLAGLERLKREHGTPQAESVRRAIAAYLMDKGVLRPGPFSAGGLSGVVASQGTSDVAAEPTSRDLRARFLC